MIELKDVSAGYGKQQVLDRVSVCFEKGKLIGVIGKNGSGKSTLLKTILGIVPLRSGEITVDGKQKREMSTAETAKVISYLSQGKSVPDMTVGEMVLHGRFPYLVYPRGYSREDREKAFAAMEKMGIADHGRKPLSVLSFGNRQKAYIAMALAQESEYILLDEPTVYLDIEHQLELMQLLRGLADSGKCVVAVMHDLAMTMTYADAVCVINDGKKTAFDTPRAVCDSGTLEKIFKVSVKFDGESYYCKY